MRNNGNELTWKDIPWADPSNQTSIPEGTCAVIPELDAHGDRSGNFVTLNHEEYVRVMGSNAYRQVTSDGSPDAILTNLRKASTSDELAERHIPTKPLTLEGMKK